MYNYFSDFAFYIGKKKKLQTENKVVLAFTYSYVIVFTRDLYFFKSL